MVNRIPYLLDHGPWSAVLPIQGVRLPSFHDPDHGFAVVLSPNPRGLADWSPRSKRRCLLHLAHPPFRPQRHFMTPFGGHHHDNPVTVAAQAPLCAAVEERDEMKETCMTEDEVATSLVSDSHSLISEPSEASSEKTFET